MKAQTMYRTARDTRLRLKPNGKRKHGTAHERQTRAQIMGDRRTGVGRAVGVRQQHPRLRSDGDHIDGDTQHAGVEHYPDHTI
jgi:hypothetical protein